VTADAEAVLTVNTALYEAFESGDADAMAAVWAVDDGELTVRCVHPGAGPVVGRDAVLRSWSLIMANTTYIQFFLTDVTLHLDGDAAVVTCTENVLAGGDDVTSFGGGAATATNAFVRQHGAWRMWLHHASPLPMVTDPS
jgi:ketosteroid isomerase-like protein